MYTITEPVANPFADTDEAPITHMQIAKAFLRAKKRASKVPRPRTYWEEPGLHGSGRQVVLRGMVPVPVVRVRRQDAIGRLPVLPREHISEKVVAGAVLVVAIGAGWLTYRWWKNRKAASTSNPPTKVNGYIELPNWAY